MATPELSRWAAASVSGAPLTDAGPQFDAAVRAYRMLDESGFPALEVSRRHALPSPVPRAGELDEGVGRGAAQAVADAALARIVARGLATSAEHPLSHVSRQVTQRCDEGKPCSRHVARYVFDYDAHLGGVAVAGSGVRVEVDREGVLARLFVRVVKLEQLGTVVAATDGPTADARLLAMARARWPTQEIRAHTPGSVVFPSPSHVDAAGVAPVWRASWVAHSRHGIVSRRQVGWIALDRADAPLMPPEP